LQYDIDTADLKAGSNVLSFKTERYTLWRGILWDSIILEWIL
jgi:rhamnogalacturonan endolyase